MDVQGHGTYENTTGRKKKPEKTFWNYVSGAVIADFFDHYRTAKTASKASSRHIADYIREMNNYGGLTDWTVCLAGKKGESTSVIATDSNWPIKVHGINRNTEKNWTIDENNKTVDLHILTSSGDEEMDLSAEEKYKADVYRRELK